MSTLINPITLNQLAGIDGLYTDDKFNLYVINKTSTYIQCSPHEFIKGVVDIRCSSFGEEFIVEVLFKEPSVQNFYRTSIKSTIRPYAINQIGSRLLKVPKAEEHFKHVFIRVAEIAEVKLTEQLWQSFYKFCGKMDLN